MSRLERLLEETEERRRKDADARDYLIEKATYEKNLNQRSVNRRAAVSAGRDMLLLEELESALKRTFKSGWTPPKTYRGKQTRKPGRTVHVVLSDLHFQSLFDPSEVPLPYGSVEESRRLGKVAVQVANYKREHRAESTLVAHVLGDIIENHLHDPREAAPLTLQVAAAINYMVQLLMYWAGEYQEVLVPWTTGNHGRNPHRHRERAVAQKWDSIESIIGYAVKHALHAAKVNNVKFKMEKTPYYTLDVFGDQLFATHGDTVLKPGTPQKKIDVAGLYHQICRFNAARNIGGPFKLFMVGHVHIGSMTNMPGGVSMLTNGCLVPPGPFSMAIGAPDVTCGQWLFESTPGHLVGDQRFIDVDDADQNASYNEVIRPFDGL